MDLGLRLGTRRLYEYLRRFGIGSKTGVDFFGESAGIMLPEKIVKNVDLVRIAFGQTVAVTPLQLAMAETAVINGGILYKPHFLQSAFTNDGRLVFSREPVQVRRVISAETSAKVRYMMREAVEHANAVFAYVPGYTLGGKTGTAQKYLPDGAGIDRGKYISSFVGFAPYDNPKYFILLMVDEPGAGAYYGSIVAAPYAKHIFEHIFEYEQIPPVNLEEQLLRVQPNIIVPDFTGLSVVQSISELRRLGLRVEVAGEGAWVNNQFPKANVKVYSGSIVLLVTDSGY
jgi:stage V sporulation protein D (sporulation-specific penicillin-binding protein)